MTGLSKTLIGIIIVGLLAAVIGATWYFTRRSLVSALTPPVLPASSSASQSTASSASSTAASAKPAETADQTAQSKDTAAKILIPLVKGWNFKSIPYILSPNKGSIVFSKLASAESYFLDPETQQYTSFLDSGDVAPGQGAALHSSAGEVLEVVSNSATAVDETKPFTIALKKGWNLVGNPFAKDINWNPTIDTGTQKLSYEKAISESVISKTYTWSPSSESYLAIDANQTVKKYQAVFLKTGGSLKLIISAE